MTSLGPIFVKSCSIARFYVLHLFELSVLVFRFSDSIHISIHMLSRVIQGRDSSTVIYKVCQNLDILKCFKLAVIKQVGICFCNFFLFNNEHLLTRQSCSVWRKDGLFGDNLMLLEAFAPRIEKIWK